MVLAYYTCNLLPIELVARSGYSPRWLGNHLQEPGAPASREALSIHPMTCPYVTKLVAAADRLLGDSRNQDCLLVPGGCDAMRRMGDLLAATYPGRVFVLSMPRSSDEGAVQSLANGLAHMEEWLQARLPADANGRRAGNTGAATNEETLICANPAGLEYPSSPQPGGVFVVAGPLSDNSLLRLIKELGAEIAGLESCTAPERWKPLASLARPEAGAARFAARNAGTGPDFLAVSAQMLAIGMCPRRSTKDRRDHLTRRLDETQPSSIIYARQSFCDPGAYDALLVARLAQERDLPYLEIEVGFPFDASGPLRTRVEAFLEAQLLDDDLLDDVFGEASDEDG